MPDFDSIRLWTKDHVARVSREKLLTWIDKLESHVQGEGIRVDELMDKLDEAREKNLILDGQKDMLVGLVQTVRDHERGIVTSEELWSEGRLLDDYDWSELVP